METSVSLKHPGFLGFCCSETGSATSLVVKKEKPMSEKNQIVVVLVVALSLGAFVDRITAKDSRWSGSAVDTAEPANGLRMYPESVLA